MSDPGESAFQKRVWIYEAEKAAEQERLRIDRSLQAAQEDAAKRRREEIRSAMIKIAAAAKQTGIPSLPIYTTTRTWLGREKREKVDEGWPIVPASDPAPQDRWQDSGFDSGRQGIMLRSDGTFFTYGPSQGKRLTASEDPCQLNTTEDRTLIFDALVAFVGDNHLQVPGI